MKKFKDFIIEEKKLTNLQQELLDYVRKGGAGKDAEWISDTLGTTKASVMRATSVLSKMSLVYRQGNRIYPAGE